MPLVEATWCRTKATDLSMAGDDTRRLDFYR